MPAAITSQAGLSVWEPTRVPNGPVHDRCRSADAVDSPALPTVRPGQLWLVEFPPTAPELAPLEYRALTASNVVIYDRALGATVARFLPLGGYGEPAASDDETWERCVQFSRDGWSVTRLVQPAVSSSRARADKLRRLAERLLAITTPGDLPVAVFARDGTGVYQKREALLRRFAEIADVCPLPQSSTVTIVFDAVDTIISPRFSVASANGLAG